MTNMIDFAKNITRLFCQALDLKQIDKLRIQIVNSLQMNRDV